MNYPNGAGYYDYEDVGLQTNDLLEEVEVSECCDAKVTPISKRCTKCLSQSSIYKKYFIETEDGSEEVYISHVPASIEVPPNLSTEQFLIELLK